MPRRPLSDAATYRLPAASKAKPWGAPKATIVEVDVPVGIDLIDSVVTGGGGPRDVKVAGVVKRQVVCRDAGLDGGEDENLPVAPDLEDGSAAVADVEVAVAIKSDAGGHAHAFRIGSHGAILRDAIHGAVIARRNVEAAIAANRHAGRVHHFDDEWLGNTGVVDTVDGHWGFLAARPGECNVDVAVGVDSGVGDGVQVFCDRPGDVNFVGIAAMSVGGNDDFSRGRSLRNACDKKRRGADDDGAFHITGEMDFRTAKVAGAQTAAQNADFASGEGALRLDGIDVRLTVKIQDCHDRDP